ncbi:MAG TPA: hypothetical protein VF526_15345 [Solirubrobacteraceae bacterium]|jgi:hypothetical protein
MAQITITVPNAVVARVQNAFAAAHGYSATVPDPASTTGGTLPNPETLPQFVQRMIRQHVQEVVRSQEAKAAGETARKAAEDKAGTEVVLS